MRFRISHSTEYVYNAPASESFAEVRVWPVDTPSQKVHRRGLEIHPDVPIDHYQDHLGNQVEFFSIPFRHNSLKVHAWADVETLPCKPSRPTLEVPCAEARQIFNSQMLHLIPFLNPSNHVPLHDVLQPLKKTFLQPGQSIGEGLLEVNQWIYETFTYESGATEIQTPISEVIRNRKGVCQDFAHLMLSILRSHGIPARYVSGYIEAYDPESTDPELVGATASHAWIEAFLPGGFWWGLDPTNKQVSGERHIRVAIGRDYEDVAPLRGTYKGATNQDLNVMVSVERKSSRKKS